MPQTAAQPGAKAQITANDAAVQAIVRTLPDRGMPWDNEGNDAGLFVLPGPHKLRDKYPTKQDAVADFERMNGKGHNIVFIEQIALQFGHETAINMVVPIVIFEKPPYVADVVVVAHPNDAERVARLHVKKSVVYGGPSNFLGDGVLATRNVDSWHEQRTNIVEGFLPLAALSKVMSVSVKRAEHAVDVRIKQTSNQPFDMCEFYLFEAMTQLHLALLGETTEFSEANNVKLREAFADMMTGPITLGVKRWMESRDFIRSFSAQVLAHARDDKGEPTKAAPFRAQAAGCPVVGPVAAKLAENIPTSVVNPLSVQRDTASTISFAGFDTTALLMTWVTFEMCRRPDLQARLQREIDEVYDSLSGRDLQYEDLGRFSFLTRVINETLRLWTSVPNGTFREIQYTELIEGPDGNKVELCPGTQVWIPSWLLHRSERLWGKDALEFNPDREWLPEESWFGKTFSGTNPASYRYAPFAYPPRGCIGMNFAQMESRVILTKAFREFSFSLADEMKTKLAQSQGDFIGCNRGTMSPAGGLWVIATPRRSSSGKL